MADAPIGVLLVNLGTPDAPTTPAVRRYLREFLSDPRVLDMPAPARWLLLHGAILPFRSRRSAAAYASIWTEQGSPLLVHGRALRDALARELGEGYAVELGMRYGEPSLSGALERLLAAQPAELRIVPLFPQYSSAANGSALECVFLALRGRSGLPPVHTVAPFFDHPAFVDAVAAVARPRLAAFEPDYVLLSYHGLPERQIRAADPTGSRCLVRDDCCEAPPAAAPCYRAHCFATSRALARALALAPERHGTSFQSRLGRTPWIRPFTDHELPRLAGAGMRRLAVLCPSFVADCLETLEEIGLRARAQWAECGGEELCLVPCVNADPAWVSGLAALVRGAA